MVDLPDTDQFNFKYNKEKEAPKALLKKPVISQADLGALEMLKDQRKKDLLRESSKRFRAKVREDPEKYAEFL